MACLVRLSGGSWPAVRLRTVVLRQFLRLGVPCGARAKVCFSSRVMLLGADGGFVSTCERPPETPRGWACSWCPDAGRFVFVHVRTGLCFSGSWTFLFYRGSPCLLWRASLRGDVRSSYKLAAVRMRPDKGGDMAHFVAVKRHFETVLSELASMATSCSAVWTPVWDLAARCFAWRHSETGAHESSASEVAPGVVGAGGDCNLTAEFRSEEVCVDTHLPLALPNTGNEQALDSDSNSDTSLGELEEADCPEVPLDPVFLPFAAKRALFEEPVCVDQQVQLDRVSVSVSFMDGATAAFDFMGQPEEHELRARVYAEFDLSEECVDVVFTQGDRVLEPLAFVNVHARVFAVKRAVATFMDCGVGVALPCTLTPCCQRHR